MRIDWHEGFRVYGEYGSVIGKTYIPWYLKSSHVECFSARDGQYHRPLCEDAQFFRLQVECSPIGYFAASPRSGPTSTTG